MRIYVASSWRNLIQPGIVHALRRCGHEVYDFRHPKAGDDGFRWQDVGGPGSYRHGDKVTAEQYRKMLAHPRAAEGYESDISHVRWCDAIVYVLPCGRSASFEFGYAMGQGKSGYVVAFDDIEPDLMFREATILGDMNDLFNAFGEPPAGPLPPEVLAVLRDPSISLPGEELAMNLLLRSTVKPTDAAQVVLTRGCKTCLGGEHPYWHPADRPCPVSADTPAGPGTGEAGKL